MILLYSQCVKARDGYACQFGGCDKTGKYLHTSHIFPKGAYPSMQFVRDNAVTLCYYHHIFWWHKNPIEAHEWIKIYLGGKYENLVKRSQQIVPMDDTFFEQTELDLREWLAEFRGDSL